MKDALPKRVIPCLDVDGGRVVKGTEFLDIRDVGDPVDLARRYEAEGADELVFLDISATTEGRSTTVELVRRTAAEVFIPLTVGGGVRSEADAQALLDAGADKVAVNSAALADPALVGRLAARFGRQCVVLAVDAKLDGQGGWEAYAAGGRVPTGKPAASWIREAVQRGAGEVLLTSIDRDGTQSGYDLGLIKSVTDAVGVPVIASGGAGRLEDYIEAVREGGAQAVLAASEFHSGNCSVGQVKAALRDDGLAVRPQSDPKLFAIRKDLEPKVAIVDYGVGNRFSVQQAFQKVGATAVISAEEDELESADALILPGVGAFGAAMERLQADGLDTAIKRMALAGKPILGICLGEQLLFESSEEAEGVRGLGLLKGRVERIRSTMAPNIGWREKEEGQLYDLLFVHIAQGSQFYHAHEYAANPDDEVWVLGQVSLPSLSDSAYKVPSVVRQGNQGNIYGVQFHPEKSSWTGLQLLRNFLEVTIRD